MVEELVEISEKGLDDPPEDSAEDALRDDLTQIDTRTEMDMEGALMPRTPLVEHSDAVPNGAPNVQQARASLEGSKLSMAPPQGGVSIPKENVRAPAGSEGGFFGGNPEGITDVARLGASGRPVSKPSNTLHATPLVAGGGAEISNATALGHIRQGGNAANHTVGHLDQVRVSDAMASRRTAPGTEAYPALPAQPTFTGGLAGPASSADQTQGGAEKVSFDAGFAGAIDSSSVTQDVGPQERPVVQVLETTSQFSTVRQTEAAIVRPEATRLVAAQMATALSEAQNKSVQISLSPEELGRVRMVLSTTDTGVAVSIMAERPETLDLMRRNIEQLAEEFRRLGYEDIKFDFSGGDSESWRDQGRPETSPSPERTLEIEHETVDASLSNPISASSNRALDLRL